MWTKHLCSDPGVSVLLCRARHPLSWALCTVGGAPLPTLPNRYVLKRLLHVSELEYVLASSNKCLQGPSLCGQGRSSVRKQMKGRARAAPWAEARLREAVGMSKGKAPAAARDTQDCWAWWSLSPTDRRAVTLNEVGGRAALSGRSHRDPLQPLSAFSLRTSSLEITWERFYINLESPFRKG